MKFPTIEGRNLEFEKYVLPRDLKGELNILIIPFQRWHQTLVDEWAYFLDNMIEDKNQVRYYEVPTLSYGYKMMSFMIDGGMQAGIPDKNVRERTITIYVNKSKFRNELKIPNENTVYLFLINKQGDILWRSSGQYSDKRGIELKKYLENYLHKK